jgi:hypothetical protein
MAIGKERASAEARIASVRREQKRLAAVLGDARRFAQSPWGGTLVEIGREAERALTAWQTAVRPALKRASKPDRAALVACYRLSAGLLPEAGLSRRSPAVRLAMDLVTLTGAKHPYTEAAAAMAIGRATQQARDTDRGAHDLGHHDADDVS